MKTHYTFSVWRSPEIIQEQTATWISQLNFMEVEFLFFDDWLKDFAFQLLVDQEFTKGKQLKKEMEEHRKNLQPLLKKLITHHYELSILEDGIDQPKQEKNLQKTHQRLNKDVKVFTETFQNLKTHIYTLIKAALKNIHLKKLKA